MSGGGGMGMDFTSKLGLLVSRCASLKDGRWLHSVGVTFGAVQGALDLFLAQPFIGGYEVP